MIKIKPMKNVAKRPQGKYGEEKPINAYAYVKTKSGKKGWIYLSKRNQAGAGRCCLKSSGLGLIKIDYEQKRRYF